MSQSLPSDQLVASSQSSSALLADLQTHGIALHLHDLSRDTPAKKQPANPPELEVLKDSHIISMAKKHGIRRVSKAAKCKLRQIAFITLEGLIEASKLYAYARCGYPGMKNFDAIKKDDQKGKKIPASIVITTEDVMAALKNRGIHHL